MCRDPCYHLNLTFLPWAMCQLSTKFCENLLQIFCVTVTTNKRRWKHNLLGTGKSDLMAQVRVISGVALGTGHQSTCSAWILHTPLSVWPHLFRDAGHEKRRGEQLKRSLAFSLYIGSFPCAQLPRPVHTACLGRVFFLCILPMFVFCVFICLSLICLCVPILLCFPGQLSHLPYSFWR